MPADNRYFPSSGLDEVDQQLSSLRAVERHLGEVEKKLDKLIDKIEQSQRKAVEKAAGKAPKPHERAPQTEPEQE
jgi:hypothetical protein